MGHRPRPRDPLEVLRVIDRLAVGPAQVEPARLRVPYRVFRGRRSERAELVFRWPEPVLDPTEPASHNLAAMTGAQVALNYGLFCREIEFRGPFDALDRSFLEEFAANTAREIYVNKFLLPNPFLVGPAASVPVVRRRDYLAARLVFPEPERSIGLGTRWRGVPERHAVLSSGGKDSILTFALLRELGLETHPIFVNESGRHWYTALNAYREFEARYPTTARVWTNSDRVFAWMLRHLPFVRRDFARIRSDAYPIRLWTVAVFVFAVLPLVRARQIGRLVVGNEHDTTVRRLGHGIPHYAGLFDQSRVFDHALTRYFQRKGWDVCQFSVLRPLSELLIEWLLVERYPELQRLQTSCHATHVDGTRFRPCGECEKCRRIVGMLKAIGAEPRRCGYSPEQVRSCLRALVARGVHQEAACAEHVAYLLRERGFLPESSHPAIRAIPHPEVMGLRFHPDRSPFDAVPNDLREGLYRIFLEHAGGAMERRGRAWIRCDALGPRSITRPYPFGSRPTGSPPDRKS
jgi:hypothetical protein